jgi:DNA ligase (NAD+)
VAIFDAVTVGGVSVTNSTLHNESEAQRKDVRVGCQVIVRRAGDVVPEVVGVVLPDDGAHQALPVFRMPSNCPVCGSQVIQHPGEKNHYCTGGMLCKAQVITGLFHFASKRAMNILGIGDSTIEDLVASGDLLSFADFYALHQAQLEKAGMGKKEAQNLLESIERSKDTTLQKYIFALGIPTVGENTSKNLAKTFGTMHALCEATFEQLVAIEDMGPITALNIQQWLLKPSNKDQLRLLNEVLRYPEADSVAEETTGATGKTFVITGSFDTYSRDELAAMIEKAGGKVSNSVGLKTNYLIVGMGGGAGKATKALELGVKNITDADALELLKPI